MARRLHKLIRNTKWLSPEGLQIRVTPSLGVASYPVDSRTKEGLLHLADEAMYLVKNTNRDSVAAANIGILPDTVAGAEPLEDLEDGLDLEIPDDAERSGKLSPERLERRREGA